jgi:hypothetical protein
MGVVALVWLSSRGRVRVGHRSTATSRSAQEQLDPSARPCSTGSGAMRAARTRCACAAGADAAGVKPLHRLGRAVRDRRRSFVLEQGHDRVVLQADWILSVADIAARLKQDLSQIDVLPPPQQGPGGKDAIEDIRRRMQSETARAARLNALRSADLRLQRADPQYVSRAGSNTAHFLLPRPSTGMTPGDYGALTLRPGSETSAIGVYAWYHLSAMEKTTRLANEQLAPDVREALTRAMLFDEAFALHFLEDAFAAGHVAGAWGDASQRQGTHDLYNAAGFEAFPWKGSSESMVLMGDAHMRPEDLDRAAGAVRTSLEQLLDTSTGRLRAANLPHVPAASIRHSRLGTPSPRTAASAAGRARGVPRPLLRRSARSPAADAGAGPGARARRHAAVPQRGGAVRRAGRIGRRALDQWRIRRVSRLRHHCRCRAGRSRRSGSRGCDG